MKFYRVRTETGECEKLTGWTSDKITLIGLVELAEEEILDVFDVQGDFSGDEEIKIEVINDIESLMEEMTEDDVIYLDESKDYKSIRVAYIEKDCYDEKRQEQLYQLYVNWSLVYMC